MSKGDLLGGENGIKRTVAEKTGGGSYGKYLPEVAGRNGKYPFERERKFRLLQGGLCVGW